MSLVIEMEVLPGTSIEVAARELCAFASANDVFIRTKFNSAPLFVIPGKAPSEIVDQWERAMAEEAGK